MVDTVLFFESDRFNRLRILRSVKNRFGKTGEVAFFQHHERGLSALALPEVELSFQNSILSAIVQGSRAIPVEVQALVSEQGSGRRTAEGLDQKRLALLSAVLNRYLLPGLSGHDIFANLAGGLSSDEVALDFSICAAVFASAKGKTLSCAFLGEVGLGGEIRTVSGFAERTKALQGCGVNRIYGPARQVQGQKGLTGIEHVCQLKEIIGGSIKEARAS
jgi:DNA repair protein RadA/Sms